MNETPSQQSVVVTDVRMPFWSMVVFMVKWAIAAIPAMIILVFVVVASMAIVSGLVASIGRMTLDHGAKTTAPAQTPQRSSAATTSVALAPDQQAYVDKVLVRNVSVGKSVLGEPGAFGEVKNTGERTLKSVEITIFCLGEDGKPVFEKKFHPVLASDFSIGKSAEPLKPGYSRQFGVKLDDAPSDWNKKVDVRVTGLEFQ
jgi:hypothetical protein